MRSIKKKYVPPKLKEWKEITEPSQTNNIIQSPKSEKQKIVELFQVKK